MSVRVLSKPVTRRFPQEWYSLVSARNFWMRWRLQAFLRLLRDHRVPLDRPFRALDVGCGHGVLREQLEQAGAWAVDGADIDAESLEMNPPLRGETLLYDVFDRRPELKDRYDFLLLFDVLEHIDDVPGFLDACLYHLKPGGLLFVNVPVFEFLRSEYDELAGHLRRYDRAMLRRHLAPLAVEELRFWGLSMLPLALARKLVLKATPRERVVATGIVPPDWAAGFLQLLLRAELSLLPRPFIGTSLLAVARK